MPFDSGNGTFTRVSNSFSQPVSSTVMSPTHADALFDDYDSGFAGVVTYMLAHANTWTAVQTWSASGTYSMGAGGSATNLTLTLSGSSGNNQGAAVRFQRNSVNLFAFGCSAGILGGTSDDFVVYSYVSGGGTLAALSVSSANSDVTAGAGLAVSNATRGLGYATGAGGTVTQSTNKATAVTLNKNTGLITMNNASLNAATIVTFVVNNSALAATDMLLVTHESGGTLGSYTVNGRATGAGTGAIDVRNNTAGALGEALVLRYAILKSVSA